MWPTLLLGLQLLLVAASSAGSGEDCEGAKRVPGARLRPAGKGAWRVTCRRGLAIAGGAGGIRVARAVCRGGRLVLEEDERREARCVGKRKR